MEEYIGIIKGFGGNFAPRGFQLCQGQLMSIQQYTALFSILGTSFGGDGRTTFGLPNLNGRAPIGQGQLAGGSSYTLGETGGTESVTLTQNQMPMHTHTATSILYGEGEAANETFVQNNLLANSASSTYVEPTGANNVALSNQAVVTTLTPAGGSQPFDNRSPYQVINWLICVEGVFPSRN